MFTVQHASVYILYVVVKYSLHLIDLVATLHRKQLAKVKVTGTLSEWLRVKKGVRQGCVLSPYLFNTLEEMVMWGPSINFTVDYKLEGD